MTESKSLFRSEKQEHEYFDNYDKALAQLPVPHETRYISTTYGDTFVIHSGQSENPTLVLLHCQGFSSMAWFYNLEQLSKYFEVFCIDSIGEPGRTRSKDTAIRNSDYVQWLSEVLNALDIERANIAGWSFGGFIATTFAINHPESINSLILMSPAGCVAPINKAFYLNLFPALFSGRERRINRFLKWISGSDNNDFPNPAFTMFTCGMKNFKGWSRGAKLTVYSKDEWGKIKAPVLIMIGENDPIYRTTPKRVVENMNGLHPSIIAEAMPGSHGFPIRSARLVNEKIISFITSITRI